MIKKLSKKKSTEKTVKESDKKSEKKTEKKRQKQDRQKRTRKISSNKLVFVMLISVVAIALIGCGIGYYINSTKMEEISIEDEDVVSLTTKYFRGVDSCIDYNLGLLSDGTVSVKDLSYDAKEEIAIDYAVKKRYNKIGFNELKEVYRLLFNDGSSLLEKQYYESTGGNYEKSGDIYELTYYSSCDSIMPDELICFDIDKAYKSDQKIKVVAGVFSGTIETQKLYSGLNWDAESFGVYGEANPDEQNLAKWEIVYKYNDKLNHYLLDYTKKL